MERWVGPSVRPVTAKNVAALSKFPMVIIVLHIAAGLTGCVNDWVVPFACQQSSAGVFVLA